MTRGYELRGFRIAAVIVVALIAAAAVWYFVIRDSGGSDQSKVTPNKVGPVAASRGDIADLSKKLGQPIYWAGNQPGTTDLELTQTADGNVYVRYLTKGAPIGVGKPDYLTVGTYPAKNATKALRGIAKQPDATKKDIPGNGIAVTNASAPTSVYVAFPGDDVEVEVFDPNPTRALDLATSGDIKTVR
jgi:hypothetical protein